MRRDDWQQRLREAIERAERKPFRWGEHDCVTFALRCLEAVLGYRLPCPNYASLRDAHQSLIAPSGFSQQVHSHLTRFPRVPLAMRQSGDIVLLPTGQIPWMAALAVVDLCPSGALMPRKPRGLARIDGMSLARAACWHIPE